MTIISAIVSILGGWRATAFAIALLALAGYTRHQALALATARADLATANAERDAAQSGADLCAEANDTGVASIARLRLALAECESGRLADTAATQAALARRDAAHDAIARDAAAARAELARLHAGRCQRWAAEPACGVTP